MNLKDKPLYLRLSGRGVYFASNEQDALDIAEEVLGFSVSTPLEWWPEELAPPDLDRSSPLISHYEWKVLVNQETDEIVGHLIVNALWLDIQ